MAYKILSSTDVSLNTAVPTLLILVTFLMIGMILRETCKMYCIFPVLSKLFNITFVIRKADDPVLNDSNQSMVLRNATPCMRSRILKLDQYKSVVG